MDGKKHFFSHAVMVSGLTTASRFLGLIRDMACAAIFGGGMVWDAFSLAFRIPNLFRRLFGEGAMSAASMPVLAEYLEHRSDTESVELVRVVATALIVVLFALLLLGLSFFLFLPLLTDMSERWRLVFALSAIMLPYMLLVCVSAFFGAVLHSRRRFAIPAFSPVVLNICWILAVVIFAPLIADEPQAKILVLAVGIVIAGVFQLIIHLWAVKRHGISYRPRLNFRHPALRTIGLNMAPVTLGMAAYQLNALFDGVLAVSLSAPENKETFILFGRMVAYPMQSGANSALYFADRLMQFPLGIFGIALSTAIFPVFSTYAAKKDWKGFSQTLTEGLGAVIFIAIPAAAGLLIIGRPAIELFFERRAFTAQMTGRTYLVLSAHTFGLWAYCARHVLERAFFACNDQLQPVKIASLTIALNVVLNLTLIWYLAESGLALATAISASVQTCILYCLLVKKTASPQKNHLIKTAVKTIVATGAMSVVCITLLSLFPELVAESKTLTQLLRVVVVSFSGLIVFVVISYILKTQELFLLKDCFGKR